MLVKAVALWSTTFAVPKPPPLLHSHLPPPGTQVDKLELSELTAVSPLDGWVRDKRAWAWAGGGGGGAQGGRSKGMGRSTWRSTQPFR